MVRGYWLALDKGEPGKVYNICSERAIQIKGLLNHLLELSSRKVEIKKDPKRMRPSDNPILQAILQNLEEEVAGSQRYF